MSHSLDKKNRYFLDKFSTKYAKNYSLFSKKNFGFNAYQKNASFLESIYEKSPYTGGYEDLSIIGCRNLPDKVIGCLHRTRVKLVNPQSNEAVEVSALHNLMVDKNHYGCGYILLSDALNRDPIFFVPGVLGELDNFYKRVAHYKVDASWYRKFHLADPINFLKRLIRIPISKRGIDHYVKNYIDQNIDLLLTGDKLFDYLIQKDFDRIIGYRVTKKFLKWRLLSNQETKITRVVLHDKKSFIALSCGIKKNIPICRIVYCSFHSQQSSDLLINEACKFSKRMGFPVILNTSDCNFAKKSFTKSNFSVIKNSPNIYFCSKSKDNVHTQHWSLMGDYGFDEFSYAQE